MLRFERSLNRRYYATYVVAFLLVFFFAYALPYLYVGKELMTTGDGLRQHFVWFAYIGRVFREALRSLLSGDGFAFPLWCQYEGFGSDVLTTGGLYFGDPFVYLSILCPRAYSEYLYNALIAVRMCLAGAAFSFYVKQRVDNNKAVLCASLVYCMGWHVAMATVHPNFLNMYIYLPLMFAGIDRIYSGKHPFLYIAMVSLSFLSSYSLAFMACLFAVPYCILLFFFQDEEHSFKAFARRFIQVFLPTIGGVALAGFLLTPSILVQLGSDRADVSREFGLLYMDTPIPVYYLNLLSGFFAGGKSESLYGQIGLGPLGVVCCITLFCTKGREYLPYKIAAIAVFLCTLFPVLGYILNAAIYPSNRWMFVFAFVGCVVIAKITPLLPELIKQNKKIIASVVAIGFSVLVIVPLTRRLRLLPALVFIVAVVIAGAVYRRRGSKKTNPSMFFWVISVVLAANILTNNVIFNKAKSEDIGAHIPIGEALAMHTYDSPSQAVINSVGELDDARYDKANLTVLPNGNMLQKLMGFNFYKSTYNNNIDRFLRSLGVATHADFVSSFLYSDLDSRTLIEAISGTKYFLIRSGSFGTAPYGYSYLTRRTVNGSTYDIYENDAFVPLAFYYDSYISESQYEEMAPSWSQEALIQGAVVDEDTAEELGLNKTQLKMTNNNVVYSIEFGDGVEREGDGFVVSENGASITLHFHGLPDSETYVYIGDPGVKLTREASSAEEDGSPFSALVKAYEDGVYSIYNTNLGYWNISSFQLNFSSEVRSNKITNIPLSTNNYYGGQSTWLVNLGYSEDPQNEISISFPKAGHYSFETLEVVCQPMEAYRSAVSKLQVGNATVSTGVNTISGSITLPDDGLIYLSIPYSEGWTVYLDGREVEPIKANLAFTAIPASGGFHEFEMTYEFPYTLPALGTTAVGITICATCYQCWRADSKRRPAPRKYQPKHLKQIEMPKRRVGW